MIIKIMREMNKIVRKIAMIRVNKINISIMKDKKINNKEERIRKFRMSRLFFRFRNR